MKRDTDQVSGWVYTGNSVVDQRDPLTTAVATIQTSSTSAWTTYLEKENSNLQLKWTFKSLNKQAARQFVSCKMSSTADLNSLTGGSFKSFSIKGIFTENMFQRAKYLNIGTCERLKFFTSYDMPTINSKISNIAWFLCFVRGTFVHWGYTVTV